MRTFYKLFEGGNVFKGPDGKPATTRIPKDGIANSLSMVEEILGFQLDQWLGTTGKKDSSGDIDVSVDSIVHDKKEVANKLKAWAQTNGYAPDDWVKLSGDNVHFKVPIRNHRGEIVYKNLEPEFAQLDLMFGNPKFQAWSMRGESGKFKGMHRHIIMASIAAQQGLKWSYKNGLVDRTTNKVISQDPQAIVRKLLPGYSGNVANLSVESILNYVYTRYKGQPDKIEALIGQAVATLAEHHGVQLPMPEQNTVHESNDPDEYFLARLRNRIVDLDMEALFDNSEPVYNQYVAEGKLRDMNHLEDLVLDEGPAGLYRSIRLLRAFAEGNAHSDTTIKWDGCVSGDSILITDSGERTIADIIENYATEDINVLAHNLETGIDEFVPVQLGGKSIGPKNWIAIKLENGSTIQLTEDHEVYTTNRGWVAAGELQEGDDIKESTIK